jgi:hypothetical protein
MDICSNAREYWEELWRLRGKGFREFHSKYTELRAAFHTIDDPTMQDIQNEEKARRDLWVDCFKEAEDFDNRQPIKPLFIFKKGRKWHELKWIPNSPSLWISPEPIDDQTLREKSNAWILPIHFNSHAVDVVGCQHCKNEFVRDKPNQKYCPTCQMDGIDFDKHRFCLNCGKHLPNGKHGKAKYCCGACRTAACKKRKSVITFPDLS